MKKEEALRTRGEEETDAAGGIEARKEEDEASISLATGGVDVRNEEEGPQLRRFQGEGGGGFGCRRRGEEEEDATDSIEVRNEEDEASVGLATDGVDMRNVEEAPQLQRRGEEEVSVMREDEGGGCIAWGRGGNDVGVNY